MLKVFHMSFFISRYFTGMLPFVYLFFALCVAGFVRRFWIGKIAFVALVTWSLFPTFRTLIHCKHEYGFLAKETSQLIQKHVPNKKLYIITNITFPVDSMESLYGFYLNRRFGANMPVFELWKRPVAERESLLSTRKDAVIWIPKCAPDFLNRLALSWRRQIGVETFINRAGCFIQMADRGYSLKPPVVFLFNRKPAPRMPKLPTPKLSLGLKVFPEGTARKPVFEFVSPAPSVPGQ